MHDNFVLLRQFFRDPTLVATVASSSPGLVAEMLRPFPTAEDPVVVELGPGTGRVTAAVQQRLGRHGRHLAVEIDPLLADRLARRFPGVEVVRGDAAHLPEILAERGVEGVHLVSSLLPWLAYRRAPVPALVASVLTPGGAFTQVTLSMLRWLPPGRRQARDVRARFGDVHLGPVVWGNLPPARVRTARTPVTEGGHTARRRVF